MKVSAIVSTFNAAPYLLGCLENLINQSLYRKGELEIIVIDSGSLQNEKGVVKEFQKKGYRIKYFRTEKRESLYAAWNHGIGLSEGKYLTNANTDDRHAPDCLEKLSDMLDREKDIGLVYGKLKKIFSLEEKDKNISAVECASQNFFPGSLFLHYPYGAQPMWRSCLHSNVGPFNPEYRIIGDYEFALRLVFHGITSKYVPEAKGEMLWHDHALSNQRKLTHEENQRLSTSRQSLELICKAYRHLSGNSLIKETNQTIDYLLDLSIRALCYYPQFSEGKPACNFRFHQALANKNGGHHKLTNNQALVDFILGNEISPKFLKAAKQERCKVAAHNLKVITQKKGMENFILFGTPMQFPTETELKSAPPGYLRKCKPSVEGGLAESHLFSFNMQDFYNDYLEGIKNVKWSIFTKVCIWGINEKARCLLAYLQKQKKISIDLLDTNKEVIDFKNKPVRNPDIFLQQENIQQCAFFLCMSKVHRKSVIDQIRRNHPNPIIYQV